MDHDLHDLLNPEKWFLTFNITERKVISLTSVIAVDNSIYVFILFSSTSLYPSVEGMNSCRFAGWALLQNLSISFLRASRLTSSVVRALSRSSLYVLFARWWPKQQKDHFHLTSVVKQDRVIELPVLGGINQRKHMDICEFWWICFMITHCLGW